MIINIISICLGIFGIIIAIKQNNDKKKLEKMIRSNNWFNYERANVGNGILQNAIKLYKSIYKNNMNIDLLELLVQSDILSQETYMSVIRNIQLFERSFDEHDIERWKKEGKISDIKADLFKKFIVSNPLKKT
jgi:hypothetical protein